MTTSTFTGRIASDHDNAARAVVPVAVGSVLVSCALSFLGAHTTGEWILEWAIELVAGAVAFGLVVPRGLRQESAGGRGLVMGVIALLVVVPAFWSGLPLVLGSAAALLGYAGKRASTGSGKATASLVVGLLAVVAYLAIYALDTLDTLGAL